MTRISDQHQNCWPTRTSGHAARGTVATLRDGLNGAAAAARVAEQALAAGEERRRQALRLASAAATAASVRRELDALTLGPSGDTIQEAADTDVFRKRLDVVDARLSAETL